MTCIYLIFNIDTNQYYTGEFWTDHTWSRDIRDAYEFDSEEKIHLEFIQDVYENSEDLYQEKFEENLPPNPSFMIHTIYRK